MNPESINQRIADFQKRFGEAHLYFAYHAAFPLALTPDLAYRLWTNFQRDKDGNLLQSKRGRILQIPWIAVADLLLSNLCKEVTHELYEMEQPIRNELLKRLRQEECFGKQRLLELAKFIETYFEQQIHSDDLYLRNFANVQRWVTLAYTNPNQIVTDLAKQLASRVTQGDKTGIVRVSSLVETVAEPLLEAGLEPLVAYSRNMEKFARGDQTSVKVYAQELLKNKQQLQVAGIPLPIPEELRERKATGAIKWYNNIQDYGSITSAQMDQQSGRRQTPQHKKSFEPVTFTGVSGIGVRIQPTVVIGLGGTGAQTITYLKKILLERSADYMQFVRFLALDIDELRGEVPSAGIFGGHVRLDPEKNEFFRITDQTRGSEAKNIPEVSSWFPDEAYRYLPLTEGARQAKPIGRLGFFLAHEEITRWVHRLTDRLVTSEVRAMFPGIKAGELNVYIVCSICGSTGAGLCLDMAYELRYWHQQAQLPEKTRIKGLFAMGDMYAAISKRVLANTYASLRELNWVQRENASFHPIYPDGVRNVINCRAFDAAYLFGASNKSAIEFDSPEDFAQLCVEFIFLDSGADVQEETGDPLSAMMQSTRNNAEVYTMNYDADGTPRCYSALGLCKIRFPADRVAELCAARMSQEIINHHIIGQLDQSEILEVRGRTKEFIVNEGLSCTDDSTDLPDRLVEKVLESGDRIPLDNWMTKSLSTAYNNDVEKVRKLEIGRFTQIVNTLNTELSQFQKDMSERIIEELQKFQRLIDKEIRQMFGENLGVNFVVKFLEEMLESANQSKEYAQQEMKNLLGHEKQLSDQMNNQIREMANLLDKSWIPIFGTRRTQLAQLKDTYKAIRQHFINQIKIMKMRAAIAFYNGAFDAKQQLMEGGEGAISKLTEMSNGISLIQNFVANLSKTFQGAYENNKRIKGSPFEILIYDNERFSTLTEIYDEVYNDAIRAKLFGEVLDQIGGSIWNVREYINVDDLRLRDLFMKTCITRFQEHINQKTVAQRIRDAKNSPENPIDYGPKIQMAYELSDYFCRLNDVSARFADLRDSEQSVVCVVACKKENDPAWNEVEKILREAIGRTGRRIPFTHTSDIHSILIYREFCGFPAYTLRRIESYYNSYVDEARRENTPPLQMLTKEPLEHITKPTTRVLSKFDVMVIEAIALGVIMSDEENYYMLTPNEWKRRKLAEEAQARGESASIEDRTAGIKRKLGSRLTEVISQMNSNLPEEARLSSIEVKWMDQVQHQIDQRKVILKETKQDLLCDLHEALYFEGYTGTNHENINRESEIRPSIEFILKREFALKEDHIFRPNQTHQELLRRIYIGLGEEPPIIT